jgi:PTS system galactitol-specific IIA component
MKNIPFNHEMLIEEDLIIIDLDSPNCESAIKMLAELLKKSNYVQDEYCQAVLERERTYPTGLATEIPVAIPHTDSKYCNIPAIAVAILESPLLFGAMGGGDDIWVEIIFMMSVVNPLMQSKWVSRLVEFFRTPGELSKLKKMKSKTEIVRFIRGRINNIEDVNTASI